MALVFANCTTWVSPIAQLIKDEAWDADHPIVKERPELFDDEPTVVRGRFPKPPPAPVEAATANPGEKRAVKARRDA